MRTITTAVALTVALLTACKKEIPEIANQEQQENQVSRQTPPPNANPAFAFKDNFTQGNRSIPGIFVMDVTGENKTRVYSNYTNQTYQTPDYPAWSSDGLKLCLTLNGADLYTLNISVVNGVPVGSGATKIGDGVANGGSYKQGKWRPGLNQVACVWKKTGDPDKIHLLQSTGGMSAVLYSAINTDWIIENDIAFKSDGSLLVFSERQISTGLVFLKVIDINSGQIIKSIDLSQYQYIQEIDWARTANSNMVAITTVPKCDNSVVGMNGIHQLQLLDVGAAIPSLTWLRNDEGNICWGPDDLQIGLASGLSRIWAGGCSISSYFGKGIYTIASGTYSLPSYYGGNHHDWKR